MNESKITDIILLILWIGIGISVLFSPNVSKITFVCCWSCLLIYIIDKIVDK